MGIPNLFKHFKYKNTGRIARMANFGCSKFIPVFLGKNSECPFLVIPNLYQSFWENCQKKFGIAIFGHSELYQSFWEYCGEKFGMPIFEH